MANPARVRQYRYELRDLTGALLQADDRLSVLLRFLEDKADVNIIDTATKLPVFPAHRCHHLGMS